MRAAHGWVPCRNYPCWWLGFLPGAACSHWPIAAKISEPSPLASVGHLCGAYRGKGTSFQPQSQLQCCEKIACNLRAITCHSNLFLGRAQLLLLVNRYCSQEWSLVNLAASMLIAVCFWGAQPERVGRCVLISFISPRFGTDWQEQSFDFFL